MRRGIIVTTLGLVALAIGWNASAEVRVVAGRQGQYSETRVLVKGTAPLNVWNPVGSDGVDGTAAQIPDGDAPDPTWSVVGDEASGPRHPWAVWSRVNGSGYDLAWSRWTAEGWQPLRWLAPETPKLGDDKDAVLAYGKAGRPYVVWWRDEGGGGRVYLSTFLVTHWMVAVPVSPANLDSRYPSLRILEDDAMQVSFDTPEGKVVRLVLFDGPVTITDDIDPFDVLSFGEMLHHARRGDGQ